LTLFSVNGIYASDYFSHALKIYYEGRFFEASIEFERAIYYETDSTRIELCRYYKSLCYKGLGKYDKALEELVNVDVEPMNDSLFLDFQYERVLCSYLLKDLNQALNNIDRIYMRFKDTSKILEVIPLNILCLNACREWDNAQILWNFYINNSRLNDSVKNNFKQEVKSLYSKKNLPRFHFAGKAETLSSFLPGSGQIYNGAVLEGSFNAIINLTFLYYTFSQSYSKHYFTGYFIGLRLFNKFYAGGIRRARSLTEEKNENGVKAFNLENISLMSRFINTKSSENP